VARRRLYSQWLNVLTQVPRVILMIGVRALLDSKLGREAARERDRQRILAKLARSVSTALAPARSLRNLSAITVVVGQVAQTPSRAFFAGFSECFRGGPCPPENPTVDRYLTRSCSTRAPVTIGGGSGAPRRLACPRAHPGKRHAGANRQPFGVANLNDHLRAHPMHPPHGTGSAPE
jgi:hypothetical protein